MEALAKVRPGTFPRPASIMRDPNRIDPMVDFLRAYWKANPDLRLGQIIGNAIHGDPYYVEDDEMLERMKSVARNGRVTMEE